MLTHPALTVPAATSEFAINASNSRFWETPVKRYVDECLAGRTGPRGKDFNMRWIASLVAEAHRILMRGGVFLYPCDHKNPDMRGRLRLLYEANPVGMHHRTGRRTRQHRAPAGAWRAAVRAAPAHRPGVRLARGSRPDRRLPPRSPAGRPAVRRCSTNTACSARRPEPNSTHWSDAMSERHPIIAITGSSGAGTTSVTHTFESIFRREKIRSVVIEGDSFHRYDRAEMKAKLAAAELAGDTSFSHFGPDNNLFEDLEAMFANYAVAGTGRHRKYLHDATKPRPTARRRAPSRPGKTCLKIPTCCSTKACTAAWCTRRSTSPAIPTC
jgi:hypothetical protein